MKVWLSNQHALYGIVVDLEQRLADAGKTIAEREALVDDLRLAEDRTRLVGEFNGRIEAIHALIPRMPADVAALVRAHTRPEETR
ncbi:hypothetical protein AB0L22_08630 [Micromonospora haikouensis]|uniref:hypothetical protein n=1 Tax=Micromonospora haikouensis TaxID=686309 RepID=UPI003415B941